MSGWLHSRRTSRLPWRHALLTAVDLETTGLDLARDHIVSIGLVQIQGGRIKPSTAGHYLVNPGCEVSRDSTLIHAIRTQDLEGAPPISALVPRIVEVASHSTLVAHAAWVERAFLRREFPRRTLDLVHIVDTAALARALGLRQRDGQEPSLEDLAHDLHLPVHTPHEALGDAFTTAQVLLVLATRLETRARRALTVGDLCKITRTHSR